MEIRDYSCLLKTPIQFNDVNMDVSLKIIQVFEKNKKKNLLSMSFAVNLDKFNFKYRIQFKIEIEVYTIDPCIRRKIKSKSSYNKENPYNVKRYADGILISI